MPMTHSFLSRALRRPMAGLKKLRDNNRGVAFVEFAFTAPIILSLGLMGTETAYYVITHMQISQIAMQVADNASRVGEQDVLEEKKVYEVDINETFVGAEKLGENLNLFANGRVILSSLQQDDEGNQAIVWQRCRGAKNVSSSYGGEGTGGENFPGMGDGTTKITASPNTAVMFVEIFYTYSSITPFNFLDGKELRYTAAFNIRDSRDLTQLHGADPDDLDPQPQSLCNVFSSDRAA